MRLTITRPDDWHLHLRDGAMLAAVCPESARHFARAIIMPNLQPPVVNAEMAVGYRQRIMAALPADTTFDPLMTIYLTDVTSPEDVAAAKATGASSLHSSSGSKYEPYGQRSDAHAAPACRTAMAATAAMNRRSTMLLLLLTSET